MARKSNVRKSSSRRRVLGGIKIPLAIVASLAPATGWALDAGMQGNWGGAGERLIAAFTGYEWGQKRFTWIYLNKGLYPLIAGFLLHGAADWIGLNRIMSKLKLPIEI